MNFSLSSDMLIFTLKVVRLTLPHFCICFTLLLSILFSIFLIHTFPSHLPPHSCFSSKRPRQIFPLLCAGWGGGGGGVSFRVDFEYAQTADISPSGRIAQDSHACQVSISGSKAGCKIHANFCNPPYLSHAFQFVGQKFCAATSRQRNQLSPTYPSVFPNLAERRFFRTNNYGTVLIPRTK